MDQMIEQQVFVGREEELERMIRALRQKKLILLTGDKGVGKTALVNELVKRLATIQPKRMVLLASQSTALKDTCLELIGNLYNSRALSKIPKTLRHLDMSLPWERTKHLFEPLGVTVLKNLFLANVRGKDCVVIFDHLGKIKLKFFSFLDSLRDSSQLVLVSRSTDRKETGRLWMLLWKFEKIEVGPLPLKEAKMLGFQLLSNCGLKIDDEEAWFDKLIHLSHGNPEILNGLCEQVKKQKEEARGTVNIQIADIDRKIDELLKQI